MTLSDLDLDKKILSDIVVHTKYARHLEDKNRRETWEEIVTRNKEMHVRKYPMIASEIEDVYNDFVLTKKVLPSMRSMQFGGRPIEINNSRIYNCAFLPVDSIYSFSETMFLLLGGCFDPATLIKTKDGDKRIIDVTVDDYVLTFDEKTNNYNWVQPSFAGMTATADKQKIELTLETGKTIKCTADHKFYTTNRGWVEAQDLTEEDDIQTFSENNNGNM